MINELLIGDFDKVSQWLKDYINKGDYSHPFVIAGWHNVGKSSIVSNAKKICPSIEEITVLFEDENNEVGNHICEIYNKKYSTPTVLCVTTGESTHVLRTLPEKLKIHILELSPDQWFEWAGRINTETGLPNVDADRLAECKNDTERIHPLFSKRRSMKEGIDNTMHELLKCKSSDIMVWYKLMNTLIQTQQRYYHFGDDVVKQWDDVFYSMSDHVENICFFDPEKWDAFTSLASQIKAIVESVWGKMGNGNQDMEG